MKALVAYWLSCAVISIAALWGLLYGGGANVDHVERPAAVQATTTSTTEVPDVPPTTEPVPAVVTSSRPDPRCGDDFDCFRACTIQIESRGDYTINTGNGHYGAWQFAQSTWVGAVSRAGYPEWAEVTADQAPPEVQDAAARQLWLERGTQPWGGRCQ